ncbi:uncharacterized protein UTRI_04888 [Ustilago trichophora]|uniref:RING-type E3 ubiquitin transferase n=1 Tax=Ustilago trichophora TaxID=86804 RepID=A0A5C3EG72_9BASI|nr:uncharacterized protein UTRI_04888 [Ustilago trichophora]
MDPPSSGSGGGDGDGGDAASRNINQMAFCHECGIEIRPLMTPDPTCPRCNGQFVEIIDENSTSNADGFADNDDPFAAIHGDPFPGFSFRTRGMGATAAPPLSFVRGGSDGQLPGGLGELLMALASGIARPPAADAARGSQSAQSETNRRSSTDQDGDSAGSGSDSRQTQGQNSTRSGSTSFGPFGLQWNVQYGSGGGDPYQRAAQHQAEHDARSQQQQQQSDFRSPPTLSNFLRFAFGPDSNADPTPRPNQDTYFHDDGMGGAGGVADGRHFNHDNRGTYHQPPQSPNSNDSNNTTRADADLPPELSALRNLFTGLFGEPGAQGGSLLDVLASGAHGGGMGASGQWGDYVLGQQGLDDIISQLMEQTQGSNAPPPATEDVIEKLERFTLNDKQRIEKAKNQDCPTCKDEFLPCTESESESHQEKLQEQGEQQQDLISMPCGHIFHVDCLVPWLRLHGTCPVCRVSIVKAAVENETGSSSTNSNSDNSTTTMQSRDPTDDPSEMIPGSWPSPPNPFTTLFGALPGVNTGVTIPRDSPSAAAETQRFHPQPPTSTTVTSTVYPSPPPTAGNVQVVNSIVSSPPIVSDRDEFFTVSTRVTERDGFETSGERQDMRERLRRAAEERVGLTNQSQGQNQQSRDQHPNLEPDQLD